MKMAGRQGLANLAMLFASRVGGVLVALFFMPLFYRLLGIEQFGVVAVILSFQGLLMTLDLGMSTMVGRDVAVLNSCPSQAVTTWRNAEVVLTVFYIVILMLAVVWGTIRPPTGLSVLTIAEVVALFWVLVLQNLGQTVLLATQSYKAASTIQLFGTLLRAGATAAALQHFAATLPVFIVTQLTTALLQLLVTRRECKGVLIEHLPKSIKIRDEINSCMELLKRGKPLFVFGLAGAAVMQLDKPIIASFISAKEVSAYFLAVTFCMTPIAVLGGPIFQYFQPKLISCISQVNQKKVQRVLSIFVFTLVLITTLSSTVLWFYRELWISLWLGNNPSVGQVITYVAILLPGVVIGALGYIPFAMLTAQQDYNFQARLSVALTIVVLIPVAYFSYQRNVYAICWVYAAYHFTSTGASWMRAAFLQQTSSYAKDAFVFAMKLLLSIVAVAFLVETALFEVYKVQYQSIIFMLAMALLGILSLLIYLKVQRNNKINGL